MFDASAIARMTRPVLATTTDGVGTKVAIAQALDRHDTIGFDLVGMVVDDIVVCGAEPLFMTDYIACGQGRPRADRRHRARDRAGLRARPGARCVGGETARASRAARSRTSTTWPGPRPGSSSTRTSSVRDRVRAGDVVLALASSGLHSNGYTLVRRVIASAGWQLDRHVDEFGRTLGEELLEPTRLYTTAPVTHSGRRRRGPRPEPRHRRWARSEPGPGSPRGPVGPHRPLDLDAACGLPDDPVLGRCRRPIWSAP